MPLGQKRLDLTGQLMNKHLCSEKMVLSSCLGRKRFNGAIAQLGERVLCKHEVVGSIPSGSTNLLLIRPNASYYSAKIIRQLTISTLPRSMR
jgi:hypothetical protein